MAKKSQRKWRWVTRDRLTLHVVDIWSGMEKPRQGERLWHVADSERISICVKEFFELTGIEVDPKTPLKVEFTAKVIP
jgi:hypothetical protein